MAKDTTFSSKFGLIAATVGSAVGLGNVWRFPSLAQENGGGAFLLVYICCIFILGWLVQKPHSRQQMVDCRLFWARRILPHLSILYGGCWLDY